jgi:hypothetical protein
VSRVCRGVRVSWRLASAVERVDVHGTLVPLAFTGVRIPVVELFA